MRLIAMDARRGSAPVLSRIYELRKTWNGTHASSNGVITVAPKGIGAAATLGARPAYAEPPKVLVPAKDVSRCPRVRRQPPVARDRGRAVRPANLTW